MNRCELPTRLPLADGAELHYTEQGRGSPLILLHDGLGDCHSWAPQMQVFAARFRVIAYSRRYSSPNRSPSAQSDYAPQSDVDDLAALQAHLRCGPAHLVGTSRGALIALMFAMQHPDQVLSLTLNEPPLHRWACRTAEGRALFEAFMDDVWRPATLAFERNDDRTALRLLVDGIWDEPLFDRLPPERMHAMTRNAGSMKALTRSTEPFPDLSRSEVAALEMPVLLLNGDRTSDLFRRSIDELVLELPRAQREVIAGAGHGAPSENPVGFNRVVFWTLLRGGRT
ncbi:alpha/beta hydrolase [Variovorax sp. J2P1-59]|uniref:alpha/beta fold hydrolase n=1 Tax=Variovorax flavidus TaxID=3053501 RepID=UPI0025783E27|nr:alpha/beta hydrolase [Variovorax sp. J2P1-59]MDM0074222.1 alpha/beta hydrolase [Variovorax sp. J2P1-59]